jgi:Ca2+-transporting ATPase
MGTGLSDAEAARRLQEDGPNELAPPARRPLWRLLLSVLTEPMFGLLLACGALYALLGNAQEAWTLMGFVIVVMAISLVQQQRAERSLHALRELSAPQAQVWREGRVRRVPSRELVRGDTVLLDAGDRVPADVRLLAATGVSADESLLTGESAPVFKSVTERMETAGCLFAGTLLTAGSARGEVVATGARSALGRLGPRWRAARRPPARCSRKRRASCAWPRRWGWGWPRCWPCSMAGSGRMPCRACWPVSRWPWPSCPRSGRWC